MFSTILFYITVSISIYCKNVRKKLFEYCIWTMRNMSSTKSLHNTQMFQLYPKYSIKAIKINKYFCWKINFSLLTLFMKLR